METYNGHVRTPGDAILLFEACRLGLLPRVQRRLSEKERQSIRSGSIFVWDEREAGMRRWTDGKSWSASRVSGSFLTYREMEGKRGGNGFSAPVPRNGKTPDSNRNSGDDRDGDGEEGPDGYRYKPDGLMKQSFSITTSIGQHLHLISYYSRSHPTAPGLQQPSTDPNLRHVQVAKGMYPESTVNDQQNVPAVTRSPMLGAPGYGSPTGYPRNAPGHPPSYGPPYGHPAYYPPSPMPTPPSAHGMSTYAPPTSLPPLHNGGPHPQMMFAYPGPQGYPMQERMVPRQADGNLSVPPGQQAGSASPAANTNYAPVRSPPRQSTPFHEKEPPSGQPGAIDPRLMSPVPPPLQANSSAQTHTPPSLQESPTDSKASDSLHTTVSASEMPRIGALVNGAATGPKDDNDKSDEEARARSRSPGGTKKEGPTDIPSEKLGFGEDKRALRQLDAHFHRA